MAPQDSEHDNEGESTTDESSTTSAALSVSSDKREDNAEDALMAIVSQRAQRDEAVEVKQEALSTEDKLIYDQEKPNQCFAAQDQVAHPVGLDENANRKPHHTTPPISNPVDGSDVAVGVPARAIENRPGAFAVAPARSATVPSESSEEDSSDDEGGSNDMAPLEATLASDSLDAPRRSTDHRRSSNPPEDIEEGMIIEGQAVVEEEKHKRIAVLAAFVVLVTTIVLLVLGLVGVFDKSVKSKQQHDDVPQGKESTSTPPPLVPTLEKIRERGVLGCAILPFEYPGYQFHNDKGEWEGYFISICQAVAAAALGNKSLVNYTAISSFPAMFQDLVLEEHVDVLSLGVTYTMEREVNESSTGMGMTFTLPHLYTGLGVGGDPFFVNECASKEMKHFGDDCQGLSVCAVDTTAHEAIFAKLIGTRQLIVTSSAEENYASFLNGTCNLIAGGHVFLAARVKTILLERGYAGNFTVGDFSLEKEPLTMASASEDVQFSDFIKVVLQSLFVAEVHNITQQTAHLFPETEVFGEDYKHMFQHAIEANGNMAEIYAKYMEQYIPRTLSKVNNGSTGLLTTDPLGEVASERMDTPLGPALQSILDRGRLRCGVSSERPGFVSRDSLTQSWVGIDVDMCLGLAAAIFSSTGSEVIEYVEIKEPREGFRLLAEGSVDVVAGAFWTLENDVKEPSTGMGFSFSLPYFYGEYDSNACLATRQEDHQWATFVKWTVAATIYAEEHNITQRSYQDMPEVNLFGSSFSRMFRSIVLAVGNYAEIYERNVEAYISRGGRNLLNFGPHFGPQVYPLPGMV